MDEDICASGHKMAGPFAFVFILTILSSFASAANFIDVKLPRGVGIQVPKGWWVLTDEHNQLIDATAEAALEVSGIEQPEGTEVVLIAANSMPRTTYASVQVTSTTPVVVPISEISSMTATDVKQYGADMHAMLKKTLPQQDLYVLNFYGTSLVYVSGYPTLISKYRRTGPKGPVHVSIIQVFTPSQDLRVALAYRESEAVIWKPVIAKMQKSITVRKWP